MLEHLPPPPPGKTGWPWTEESESLAPMQPEGKPWPRISIITPSLNQGEFIEEAIRSVLLQNYPNMEYIIIDGKSSDYTVDIIRKYEPWINFWLSETDKSQSHAINKGFKRCTGVLVNWICSDDMLNKNALNNLISEISGNRNALFIGRGFRIDRRSNIIDEIAPPAIRSFIDLVDIGNFWRNGNSVMQQSCLFPLEEVEFAGYLDEANHYTMDYELWGKFLMNGVKVVDCNTHVGLFRWYGGQKTSENKVVTKSLIRSAFKLIGINKELAYKTKSILRVKIIIYNTKYYYHFIRSKIGIRRRIRSLSNVASGSIHS